MALVFLVLNIIVGSGAYAAIASFAAICCIGAPVMLGLGLAIPFLNVSRRLRKKGAAVTGCEAVDEVAGVMSVIADSGMIFPPETVAVHAIKTFSGVKIEHAILDAASLISAVNGPLRDSFLALISEESRGALEKVENAIYADELGLCAVIEGRQVLLGSRDLLRTRNVETPSREFEAKYAAEGRDILYLASEGSLNAMFVVGYYSNK